MEWNQEAVNSAGEEQGLACNTEEALSFSFFNCGKIYTRLTILTIAAITTTYPQDSFSSVPGKHSLPSPSSQPLATTLCALSQ